MKKCSSLPDAKQRATNWSLSKVAENIRPFLTQFRRRRSNLEIRWEKLITYWSLLTLTSPRVTEANRFSSITFSKSKHYLKVILNRVHFLPFFICLQRTMSFFNLIIINPARSTHTQSFQTSHLAELKFIFHVSAWMTKENGWKCSGSSRALTDCPVRWKITSSKSRVIKSPFPEWFYGMKNCSLFPPYTCRITKMMGES